MISLQVTVEDQEMSIAFEDKGPPRSISQITISKMGQKTLYNVTGWKLEPEPSPCPVYAQKINDSGDGIAYLIHASEEGSGGIMIKPASLMEPWSPNSPDQESRAYIILRDESLIRFSEPA